MALFEEILNLPINLIKNYILQNKFYKSYNQDPATMPASTRYTANLFWMLGRNIKLTAKKVNLAEEFLNLLEEIVKPINLQQLEEKNSLNLESTTHALELPLKELQKKINLELRKRSVIPTSKTNLDTFVKSIALFDEVVTLKMLLYYEGQSMAISSLCT
jgi:hypothetical protein